MMGPSLVTGASELLGECTVRHLRRLGIPVRVVPHGFDPRDVDAARRAADGVECLYHFHERTDPTGSPRELQAANVEGTHTLWECARERGVRTAVLCSSTAVYGLMSRSGRPITEADPARAVEPYGRSKVMAETLALAISEAGGPRTIVLRPVAPFGPNGRNPVGLTMHKAPVSAFLLAGIARSRRLSFVHAEDVARAAVHLVSRPDSAGRIFNVVAPEQASLSDALRAYVRTLKRAELPSTRARVLAWISLHLPELSRLPKRLARAAQRYGFESWRPDLYLTYCTRRLLATGFRYRWPSFNELLMDVMPANVPIY